MGNTTYWGLRPRVSDDHTDDLSWVDLITGNPVTLDSLNAVYHTGNRLYRNLRVSRILDL